MPPIGSRCLRLPRFRRPSPVSGAHRRTRRRPRARRRGLFRDARAATPCSPPARSAGVPPCSTTITTTTSRASRGTCSTDSWTPPRSHSSPALEMRAAIVPRLMSPRLAPQTPRGPCVPARKPHAEPWTVPVPRQTSGQRVSAPSGANELRACRISHTPQDDRTVTDPRLPGAFPPRTATHRSHRGRPPRSPRRRRRLRHQLIAPSQRRVREGSYAPCEVANVTE